MVETMTHELVDLLRNVAGLDSDCSCNYSGLYVLSDAGLMPLVLCYDEHSDERNQRFRRKDNIIKDHIFRSSERLRLDNCACKNRMRSKKRRMKTNNLADVQDIHCAQIRYYVAQKCLHAWRSYSSTTLPFIVTVTWPVALSWMIAIPIVWLLKNAPRPISRVVSLSVNPPPSEPSASSGIPALKPVETKPVIIDISELFPQECQIIA